MAWVGYEFTRPPLRVFRGPFFSALRICICELSRLNWSLGQKRWLILYTQRRTISRGRASYDIFLVYLAFYSSWGRASCNEYGFTYLRNYRIARIWKSKKSGWSYLSISHKYLIPQFADYLNFQISQIRAHSAKFISKGSKVWNSNDSVVERVKMNFWWMLLGGLRKFY